MKDIADVLTVGDEVKVKIMSVDEASGKISLSIRATQEAPARPQSKPRTSGGGGARKPQATQQKQQGFNTLEDKLKEWLKQSNEIQADLNKRAKK